MTDPAATDTTTALAGDGDVVQTPTEPTPVDSTTSPGDLLRAIGFDPATVQAVVVTPTSVVAVAADYPDPPGTSDPTVPDDGAEPDPTPDTPTEEA